MGSQSSSSLLLWLLSTLRPRPMLMLMPTTAPWATTVWATPTMDTTDSGPMLPPPTTVSGLTAMLPPTPMAPTGTSARGLLMLTSALWVSMFWATPTTDTTATGLTPLPPSSTTVSGLTAMLPPTPMVPTGTSARGLLMLSPRPMLMLTTALWATTVWATPTTDSTDTDLTPLPPSSTTASALTAMLPPTPMAPTGISARGPLMLSPRLMLMLTTAP